MLTISRFRYPLIFIFLGLGVALHWQVGWSSAWMLYLSALVLFLVHLLFGDVWQAFRLLQRGQPAQAEQLLDRTLFPRLLVRRPRAYYHFACGMIALQQQRLEEGREHLQEALSTGLYRANDRALAQLNLAHIAFVQMDWPRAGQHRRAALAEQPTDLMIREQLQKLERALKEK